MEIQELMMKTGINALRHVNCYELQYILNQFKVWILFYYIPPPPISNEHLYKKVWNSFVDFTLKREQFLNLTSKMDITFNLNGEMNAILILF